MKPGEIIFSHVVWEKRSDGMWRKVEYIRPHDSKVWGFAQVFDRELTDKEYFKAKLNGNL